MYEFFLIFFLKYTKEFFRSRSHLGVKRDKSWRQVLKKISFAKKVLKKRKRLKSTGGSFRFRRPLPLLDACPSGAHPTTILIPSASTCFFCESSSSLTLHLSNPLCLNQRRQGRARPRLVHTCARHRPVPAAVVHW